jgi:flavin-dependent dehydrogenase
MLADALVIGGGIAGSAVAAHLAQAGRHVVLVERKAGPHDKVCGEFVSGEAALYLRGLGIDLESLGAVGISAVRVYASRNVVCTDLPFPAFSLSRRVLDEAILCMASTCGAELRRGRSVRFLRPLGSRWIAELDDGSSVPATDSFLATGKHDLRGWKRPPAGQNDLVAFKLHWRLAAAQTAALGSYVELFMFPGGYAGLSLVENGIANLCLVIRRSHFARLNNMWQALLVSLRAELLPLHQRLAGAEACSDRPLAIASIPYGYVQKCSIGPWCLGDQAAVIPSFSGDGIAIALHSARLAAEYYLAGKANSEFQSRLGRDTSRQVEWATLLSRLLVHRWGQAIAMGVMRAAPTLIGSIAYHTRIPSDCLMSTQNGSMEAVTSRG